MHGVGSNDDDLFGLAPYVPAQFHVLSLQAPYALGPAPLIFGADTGAAAKYTLAATSGTATKTLAINVSAAVPPVIFTFP